VKPISLAVVTTVVCTLGCLSGLGGLKILEHDDATAGNIDNDDDGDAVSARQAQENSRAAYCTL